MTAATPQNLGFDADALRTKYRAERDRRLRADGNAQYQEIKGNFAHYLDDPYVAPITRAPLTDEVDVVVVGGGFGGLLAAARLREAGVERIRIIEKGGDFGGTWYWNRYPGAACDVESYIYLPLIEEVGKMPVEKYSRAPEILAHCRAIGEKYDLYRDAVFQTEINEMRWDEKSARWVVKTNRNDAIKARFVCLASGPLHRPKLPGIPGVETFKGHSFHTSRWDYAYTGGDSNGNLSGLKDKRVAIIGTGATAVQCVPHLGAAAKHLFVFQRTPSSIDVRANRPTDPAWAKALEPGWQQRRMDNFNTLLTGVYQKEDLVSDGWTEIIRNLLLGEGAKKFAGAGPLTIDQLVELADFEKMEQVRARVDAVVKDKTTAEALKPYYRQFCKRPCFHDEYLDTFNRPNVTLVDTKGHGVDRITENAIVANGVEYPVDCIIYATGFEVGTGYSRRAGFELYGKGGQSLTDKWSKGIRTFHGFHVEGFPNCFIVSNAQSGFTVNFPHMLAEQARHVAYVVKHCSDAQIRVVEATPAAEAEWVETIRSLAILRRKFLEECTPGYYNNEGKPQERSEQDGFYGAGPIAFVKVLEEWRAEGALKGLDQRGA
ncbi:MAG: NAD(P)/FAD-dependent oxidoreductase [Alphaproteobacteria bacterium]|nr:NAD(P)/FAD-dependent oxidoreductase [Alphaproteobacteria bacterium]